MSCKYTVNVLTAWGQGEAGQSEYLTRVVETSNIQLPATGVLSKTVMVFQSPMYEYITLTTVCTRNATLQN
jgi:hypothetical protein